MAYRVARFAWLHAARLAGSAGITASTGTFDADGEKAFLIDGRRTLALLTGTNPAIDIDRGAGSLAAVSRLLIPSGHNLDGETIQLEADSVATFDSPSTVLVNSVTVSGTGFIDEAFTSSSLRYLRFIVESFGPDTADIPQLIITATQTPTIGPDPAWGDGVQSNLLRFEKQSRDDAVLQTAAAQRVFEYEFRAASGADLTLFDALVAHAATGQRFILDPVFDDETPLWVEMVGDPQIANDFPIPTTGTKAKRYRMVLREVIA